MKIPTLARLSCALTVLALWVPPDASAQLNRREVKRNNYRMATYQGRQRVRFGADKKYSAIEITANAFNYYGDLSPMPNRLSTDISFTKPGIGISYSHRIGARYAVQTSLMYGTLSGSDAESAKETDTQNGVFRYQRNLSFRNRIQEISVNLVTDLFKNESSSLERVAWTPYLSAGIAVFHHNPMAKVPQTDLQGRPLPNAGEWVSLKELGTEGQNLSLDKNSANYGIQPYKRIQPALILGPGVRVRINDNLDCALEFTIHYTFTDYLDDVSRNYIDLGLFGNNELAKAMSYRSNEIVTPSTIYTSEFDGKSYAVLPGYGSEHPDNIRGSKKNMDLFTVTTVRLAYVFERYHHKRPKHR